MIILRPICAPYPLPLRMFWTPSQPAACSPFARGPSQQSSRSAPQGYAANPHRVSRRPEQPGRVCRFSDSGVNEGDNTRLRGIPLAPPLRRPAQLGILGSSDRTVESSTGMSRPGAVARPEARLTGGIWHHGNERTLRRNASLSTVSAPTPSSRVRTEFMNSTPKNAGPGDDGPNTRIDVLIAVPLAPQPPFFSRYL